MKNLLPEELMIENFRNKKYLSTKKEIKINIEAMTQCAAGCAGCYLTPDLRAKSNLWSLDKFNKAGKFSKQFLKENKIDNPHIDEFTLIFGQGDYLLLSEQEIINMLDEVCSWFPNFSSLVFTSSGITKHEVFKRGLDIFHQKTVEKNLPFSLALVLDSSKLDTRFFPTYEKNINYAKQKLGFLDLHINLGIDVINNISPFSIDKFLKENNIGFITVNFVPSFHSNITLEKWGKISNWLKEWVNLWNPNNYNVNFIQTVRHHFGAFSDDEDFFSQLISSNSIVQREVVIDYDGNGYTKQEGIGDIALSNRNGFTHFINIFEDNIKENILNRMLNHQNTINKTLIKSFTTSNSCMNCDYSKVCTQLGVIAMKNVLGFDAKRKTCEYNLPEFYKSILTLKENEELKIIGDNFDKIRVQKDLKNIELDILDTAFDDKNIDFNLIKK